MIRRALRPLCLLAVATLSVGAIGCGGGKPGAATSSDAKAGDAGDAAAEPEAGAVQGPVAKEGHEQSFSNEEQRLQTLLDLDGSKTGNKNEPQPKVVEENGQEISALNQEQRCTRACKALASMKRSANSFCEMTGEDDPRCVNLRDRVERARLSVAEKCPTCAAAKPQG